MLVFDDENNHIRRNNKEVLELFKQIITKENWIIEDVGRPIFEEGIKECDKIYYINISKIIVYFRVIKRWLKQRFGRESYNYPPTFYSIYDTLKTTYNYYKKEKTIINRINNYLKKVKYIDYHGLNSFFK